MSNTSYPATTPPNSAQSQVTSVVVGYVDANGNFQPATSAAGLPVSGGGGGGGGAITAAAGSYSAGALVDGANVVEGTTTDAAPAAGAAGTMNAHLRAISRDIGTVAANVPAKGQTTSANSQPVVIASDQSAIPVTGSVSTTAPTDATSSGSFTAAGQSVTFTNLNGAATLIFSVTGTYAGLIAAQVQVDGTNWVGVNVYPEGTQSGPPSGTVANAATGIYKAQVTGAQAVRVTASTLTSGTAVITARVTTATDSSQSAYQSVSIAQIGGSNVLSITSPGGATGSAMVTSVASSTSVAVYSAVSTTTSAKTGLATITDANGVGTICSYLVNLTAFTAGSSTGLDFFLQWSPDGGTTWVDMWQTEAFTATGTAYIPPMYIPGRWRFAYQNRGGAATTATVTITATRLNLASVSFVRQFYDRTAAVLAGTPVGSVTAAYDVSGCKIVTATIGITTKAGTTDAAYQIQTSADGVIWSNIGATTTTLVVGGNDIVILNNSKRFARVIVTTAAVGTAQVGSYVAITGTN